MHWIFCCIASLPVAVPGVPVAGFIVFGLMTGLEPFLSDHAGR